MFKILKISKKIAKKLNAKTKYITAFYRSLNKLLNRVSVYFHYISRLNRVFKNFYYSNFNHALIIFV